MDCLVTSGFNVEGSRIVKYCGFLTSRQLFSGISFIKRNDKSDESWDSLIDDGVTELKGKAIALGANAIIGLHLECVSGSTLVTAVLTATAVLIENI